MLTTLSCVVIADSSFTVIHHGEEILKNCYLTKINTKSVILTKKVVREVIYESAKFEVTKLLCTKSYSKHVFPITMTISKYLLKLYYLCNGVRPYIKCLLSTA